MKTKIGYLFLLLGIFGQSSHSQVFKIPESAAFDSAANLYFISNYGDGSIVQIDSSGEKSYFKRGLSKPLGMILCGKTLYVVDNPKTVSGFDITDGKPTMAVQIAQARFLNDIAQDTSGFLYVTDSNAVFKINVVSQSATLFVKTRFENANGIVYDAFNNRLLICYFREKASIDAISLEDSSISAVVSTPFDNLDGLSMDASGNVYVSSWGAGSFASGFTEQGKIVKYDNLFKQEPVVVSTGLYGPADIFFNRVKNELVIPLFLSHTVTFLKLEQKDRNPRPF